MARRFSKIYVDETRGARFCALASASPSAAVLLWLWSRKSAADTYNGGAIEFTHSDIAQDSGLTVRQVRRALETLCNSGAITVSSGDGRGRGSVARVDGLGACE